MTADGVPMPMLVLALLIHFGPLFLLIVLMLAMLGWRITRLIRAFRRG